MNVIVVFPKIENGKNIKRILLQSGFTVLAVCTTGAQALQYMHTVSNGIIVCGFRFIDMNYLELYEYLPSGFAMLLLAPPSVCESKEQEEIVCLNMPLRIHELIQTLHMMADSVSKQKKHGKKRERTGEEKKILSQAKAVLMERNHMTEEEAHRYLQKRSMDNGTTLAETAQMVLSLMNE